MTNTDEITLLERVAQLEAALADLSAKTESLARDNAALASDNSHLSSMVADLSAANGRLEAEVATAKDELAAAKVELGKLVSQILLANARAFGAKSEKYQPHQLSLLNDVEASFDAELPEPAAEEVAKPARKRKKRECVDWSKYETVIVEHRIDKPECPECEAPMKEMGYQVKRVFKVRPAQVYVEEHRQYKYVCPDCSDANQADGGETPVQIVKAEMPAVTPVEGSCASASLVAYVMDRKYCMGLPIYRISQDLKSTTGLTITRQAMAGWVIKAYERWLSLIYSLMRERLMEMSVIQVDETRIQCLKEPGRKPTTMSWAWLFCSCASDVPVFLFKYDPSRGHGVPDAFIDPDWSGTIVADGHVAYSRLLEKRGGAIRRVSCLVHARRKFKEVLKGSENASPSAVESTAAMAAIRMMDRIFHVDNAFDGMGPIERAESRERELGPLLDELVEWCEGIAPTVMPGTLLDAAVTYSRNQLPYLYNALSEGKAPIENNRAESAIRPFAVGRKNWLFSDTQQGAEASCGIYSIACTARANGLMPMRYLEWLLEELPNIADPSDRDALTRLLPWSDAVPESCRMTPAEALTPNEMDAPVIDVDPHIFDEE